MCEWIKIFSGFLTPVIALVTTYIAIQQYRTNKTKLRLELYHQRFKVFEALMEFVGNVVSQQVSAETVKLFDAETNEASFLFGSDVCDYLALVRNKAAEIGQLSSQIEALMKYPVNEERTKLVNQKVELIKWFYEQLPISKAKFAKYLAIAD